jgi:hypothetical protein
MAIGAEDSLYLVGHTVALAQYVHGDHAVAVISVFQQPTHNEIQTSLVIG